VIWPVSPAASASRSSVTRLLYRIDDDAQRVYVVQIDHRADVYRPR